MDRRDNVWILLESVWCIDVGKVALASDKGPGAGVERGCLLGDGGDLGSQAGVFEECEECDAVGAEGGLGADAAFSGESCTIERGEGSCFGDEATGLANGLAACCDGEGGGLKVYILVDSSVCKESHCLAFMVEG